MLKTLFYIFIIYLVYQIVRGLFTAKKVVNNFNDAARHQYEQQQRQNHQSTTKPDNDNYKKATDNIGDYVDYEEVDDDK